ncbi:Serine protease Do-like HtrB [Acaryochloris thomasi RCC1774]|uniref:Serine protease Do-like HtrB n=1 Tax=Acaryochloris thomasi RCC1774 TaxID=1764569 RepID=A0A2W1JK22_9CYAN|nr:DUF2808 domain-containing protein [Acaryochloris thomasi]PZD73758.1 Serine protease Do-like HtrB [Acaryochloris thomasi RCC1774]
MRPYSLLSAFLLGGAVLITQPTELVAREERGPLEGSEVNQIAKASTILLEGQNPGSGVVVGQEGSTYYVLTAQHVVATEDEYAIVTPDGQTYPLDYGAIQKIPDVDLAIVPFTSGKAYSVAKLGNSDDVTEGDRIFIAGWPAAGRAIPHIYQLTSGEVSGISRRPIAGGYGLVYTNVTRAGMSGGPVFNSSGQVIGIHGLAEGRQVVLPGYDGDSSVIKAGFNLGIPINTFVRLAQQTRLAPAAGSSSTAPVASPSPVPTRPTPLPTASLTETTPLTQVIQAPVLPAKKPSRVAFVQPPRLLKATTSDRIARNLGATYSLVIDLPATAAAPLQQVDLILKQGVQYPRFKAKGIAAYEGSKRRGPKLPLGLIVNDPPSRTVTIAFDPPVQPGRQFTLAVRPVRNPSVGTYLFEVRGFPEGEVKDSTYLGLARLDFVRSSPGK